MHQKRVRLRSKQKGTETTSTRRSARAAPEGSRELQSVRLAANSYCLRHYGVGYSGGAPQHLLLRAAHVWIVPAVLTSPGYGVVGEVGVVAVDAVTHKLVGATPPAEVREFGTRLAEGKQDELEAAFRQARKA